MSSMAADIGRKLTVTLTDGRTIEAVLTFGDFARAEIDSGTNYMTAVASDGDIALNDVAMLCYQAARRTKQFEGTWDEWLMLLKDFPDIEVPEDDTNAEGADAPVVAPFSKEARAIS